MKTLIICAIFCISFVIVAILADYGIYKLKRWYREYSKTKGCL